MEKSKYYWIKSQNKTSNNSPWLRSNLIEFDAKTEKVMKLIDVDEVESFAKRAEAFYVKKPELFAMIEDIYRMHSSLLFRYDRLKAKTLLNCNEDSLSENSEVSEVEDDDDDDDDDEKEIERLRREKDEEKREVVRQLSMTIDMLKSENFEMKKSLSTLIAIGKIEKKQTLNPLGFVRNPLGFVKSKLGFY